MKITSAHIVVISLLFITCASAEDLIDRALKKDENVLKDRISADVEYIRDTIEIVKDGEVLEIIREIPIEVPVLRWEQPKTKKTQRLDNKLRKAEIKRYNAITDSLKLNNRRISTENKLLKEQVRSLKKENRAKWLSLLRDYWVYIVGLIVIIIILPSIFKWIKNLRKSVLSK